MRRSRSAGLAVLAGVGIGVIAGCAKVGSPAGGPEDKVPPRVVMSSPADSAVNVDRRTGVVIEFSKRMHKESVERALFISPYPDPYPRLDWSRGERLLALHFDEPLDSNRTYVITVGTDARDSRNNRLASAFSFAFATGPRMNSGRIVGSAWEIAMKPAVGATVGLYPIGADSSDPDPSLRYPLYTTQAGERGGFSFGYLPPGRYRVFAWRDRESDELIGPDEAVAVPARDAIIGEGETARLPGMILLPSDRRPPELVLIRPVDRTHAELRFDEPVPAESLSAEIVSPDTLAATVIPGMKPSQTVIVRTSEMVPGRSYGVRVHVADQAGNRAEYGPDTTLFDGTGLPDTTAPGVLGTELPQPVMSDTLAFLALWFDDVLGEVRLDSLDVWEDSLRVGGTWRRTGVNRLAFRPAAKLSPGRTLWRIPLGPISDLSGNRGRDTLRVVLMRVPPDSLGELTGTVTDSSATESAKIIIQARPLRGEARFETSLPGPGPWGLPNLPAGGYTLFAWHDRDEDGLWSPGGVLPFRPAERWTASDTVYVRARWTVPGGSLTFE